MGRTRVDTVFYLSIRSIFIKNVSDMELDSGVENTVRKGQFPSGWAWDI